MFVPLIAFEGHFGGELRCSIEHGGLCASHWTNGAPPRAAHQDAEFPHFFLTHKKWYLLMEEIRLTS